MSVSNYVMELQEKLSMVHQGVRNKIKLSSDRIKARYDLRANSAGFKDGDQVWLCNPQRRRERSPKLQSHWEGPYRVTKRINDVVHRIQKSPKAKMKVVHLDRLLKYQWNNLENGTVRT